jgi:hypothetical protein
MIGVGEQVYQVSAEFTRAWVLPPLGVPVGRRRGRVGVLDEDDGIPARLVDVVTEVNWAEAGPGFGEDP